MIHKLVLVAGSLGAMVLAVSACEVTLSDDGGGGHAGHHHMGGNHSGGTGGTSSVTSGPGSGGMGGMAPACVTCTDALTACNMGKCLDSPNYCDGSKMIFDAAFGCACAADVCGTECGTTCGGSDPDASTCISCLQTAILQTTCKMQGDACIGDM